jgi:peptidoglycan-associated lipoprotein
MDGGYTDYTIKGGTIMTRKTLINLAYLLAVLGLVFTVSCSKKMFGTGPDGNAGSGVTKGANVTVGSQNVAEEYRHLAATERFPGEKLFFQFDSSMLLGEARENLRRKAKWFLTHSDLSVVIEGHCDERGMNAYNIALGDQRAKRVKEYLTNLGVDPKRLTTISYGEERPLDAGKNEEAWAKNRRVQFE